MKRLLKSMLPLALIATAGCSLWDKVSGGENDLEVPEILSEQEAEAKASAEITADNADAEFEKLKAEIEAEAAENP